MENGKIGRSDGKTEHIYEAVRIIGTWEGPFRRTNPSTGKRGRKYMRAFVRPMGTDNEAQECILQASGAMSDVLVNIELRKHSTGEPFLCAWLAPGNRSGAQANQDWETTGSNR